MGGRQRGAAVGVPVLDPGRPADLDRDPVLGVHPVQARGQRRPDRRASRGVRPGHERHRGERAARRGRDLRPREAAAHDRHLGPERQAVAQGLGVGAGAQGDQVRVVGAGDVEGPGSPARGEHDRVRVQDPPGGRLHPVGRGAAVGVDAARHHPDRLVLHQLHPVLGEPCRRGEQQAVRVRVAGQELLAQGRPVIGHALRVHEGDPARETAAPQLADHGEARDAAAHHRDRAGHARRGLDVVAHAPGTR